MFLLQIIYQSKKLQRIVKYSAILITFLIILRMKRGPKKAPQLHELDALNLSLLEKVKTFRTFDETNFKQMKELESNIFDYIKTEYRQQKNKSEISLEQFLNEQELKLMPLIQLQVEYVMQFYQADIQAMVDEKLQTLPVETMKQEYQLIMEGKLDNELLQSLHDDQPNYFKSLYQTLLKNKIPEGTAIEKHQLKKYRHEITESLKLELREKLMNNIKLKWKKKLESQLLNQLKERIFIFVK